MCQALCWMLGILSWARCRLQGAHRIAEDTTCDMILNHAVSFYKVELAKLLLLFSRSVMSDFFVTPWTAARQASLSFTISQSLLKLMSIEFVMPSNHLVLCRPLFSCFSLSQEQGFFQWVDSFASGGQSILSFSFSKSPSNEYSGLISFRVDRFDLLTVQQTLKSLLQHPVWKHQFFGAQPSFWSNSHIDTWLLEKP